MRRLGLVLLLTAVAAADDGAPDVRDLLAALDSDDAVARHDAAVALARRDHANERVVAVLTSSLDHDEWYARWQACLALRQLGSRARSAIPALVSVARDTDKDLIREAVLAMTAIAPDHPTVVVQLMLMLKKRTKLPLVFIALQRCGPHAKPALMPLLSFLRDAPAPALHRPILETLHAIDPRPEVWRAAVDFRVWPGSALALRYLERDARIETCLALTRAPPPWDRVGLQELGAMGERARPAIPHVVRRLGNARLFGHARSALERIGGGPLLALAGAPRRKPTADDPEAWAVVLRPRVAPSTVAPLLDLLRDDEIGERTLRALGELDSDAASVRRLAGLLQHRDPRIRECAALLLRACRNDPAAAITALEDCLDDPAPGVRDAVRRSMFALESHR